MDLESGHGLAGSFDKGRIRPTPVSAAATVLSVSQGLLPSSQHG